MKTQEEIKRELGEGIRVHYHISDIEPSLTPLALHDLEFLHDDALAIIQRLEAELEDMTARYKIADDCAKKKGEMNEKLYAELATVKAERDAALADFKLYRERNIKGECGVYACDLCKRGGRYEDWDEIKCPTGCSGVSHWEWRGVQKEE